MDKEKDIGNKIVDYLLVGTAGELTEPLKDWSRLSDENSSQIADYKKIWDSSLGVAEAQSYDKGKAWGIVDINIQRRKSRQSKLKNAMYASIGMAASLILVLAFAFYTEMFSSTSDKVQFSTENGSRSTVVLPDGSQLKLNAGTEIRYQYNKITRKRELFFSGEAFFDVAHSKTPFILKTRGGMNLEVLGTKFNVSAYPENRNVKTTLVEGSILLSNEAGDKLLLKPDQVAQFNNKTKNLKYIDIGKERMLGWIENKIVLDHTSLLELKYKLERLYGVEIELTPATIGKEISYTGVFAEETITDVLGALEKVSSINYSIKGKKVTITKK